MSVKRVRCACRGNPDCQLCRGEKYYDYEVGPRGWMPFTCPTCKGTRTLPAADGVSQCFTCQGVGSVDPAYPPQLEGTVGFFRKAWKIFFGS